MSHPATMPAPPPAAPASSPAPVGAPTAASSVGATNPAGRGAIRRDASVPGGLQVLRLIATAVILLWAGLTAGQLFLSWQSLGTAAGDVEQLIRVQDIKVELLRADALATNAFLVGGLEPSEQRAAYDEAIEAASQHITEAASAQGADEAVLRELGTLVVGYAGTMELARANNRQGLPVGAAYLSDASATLRARGLSLVDALVEANTNRSLTSLADQHPWWIAIPGVLALAALWWANRWVALRFKRRVNVGLALGAAVVLGLSAVAVFASATQAKENSTLRTGDFNAVVLGADARGAANLAKSAESLRLIGRGNAAAQEKAWAGYSARVEEGLRGARADAGLLASWQAYADAHAALVKADDGGDWDGAVADATAGQPGGIPALFSTFDTAAGKFVDAAGQSTTDQLAGGRSLFLLWAFAAGVLGLLGSALAWRGLTQRLKEYE